MGCFFTRLGHVSVAILIATQVAGCGGAGDQSTGTDLLLEQGRQALDSFGWQDGYAKFSAAVEQSEVGADEWQEAVYGVAICAWHMPSPTAEKVDIAQRHFKMLLEHTPENQRAPKAVLNLGRIQELRDYQGDLIDLEGAREYYQKVLDTWPDGNLADEAMMRLAGSYIQVFDNEESVRHGVGLLEDWLQERPENALASAMLQYVAGTYQFSLDDEARALDFYVAAAEIGLMDQARAGVIYWRMATMGEEIPGRLDVAIAYYIKVVVDTPFSGRSYEAREALVRIRENHPALEFEIPELKIFGSSSDVEDVL